MLSLLFSCSGLCSGSSIGTFLDFMGSKVSSGTGISGIFSPAKSSGFTHSGTTSGSCSCSCSSMGSLSGSMGSNDPSGTGISGILSPAKSSGLAHSGTTSGSGSCSGSSKGSFSGCCSAGITIVSVPSLLGFGS